MMCRCIVALYKSVVSELACIPKVGAISSLRASATGEIVYSTAVT